MCEDVLTFKAVSAPGSLHIAKFKMKLEKKKGLGSGSVVEHQLMCTEHRVPYTISREKQKRQRET